MGIGGSSLLQKYKGSPFHLISTIYPEVEWLPWKFTQSPKGFWADVENQKTFIQWASKQLNIRDLSDWYNVSPKVIKNQSFVFKNKGFV